MSKSRLIRTTWRLGWYVSESEPNIHHPREQRVYTVMWRGAEWVSFYGTPTRRFGGGRFARKGIIWKDRI